MLDAADLGWLLVLYIPFSSTEPEETVYLYAEYFYPDGYLQSLFALLISYRRLSAQFLCSAGP